MDKIIYEKVGQRLKHARELRHITLEEAGKKVDVHKSTILRWENGETEKFKIPTLEILANFYNVNPTWLMGYDVPMEKIENDSIDTTLNTQIENNYGHDSIKLLDYYKQLNDLGKEKALENTKDLTKIQEYTEKKTDIQDA